MTSIEDSPLLTLRLLRQLKECGTRFKAADSTGVQLSGRDLLIRTLALRSYLLREHIADDERRVGVFLPPTVPAVASNFALALADRVSVNLNYTVSTPTLQQCVQVAGLKHVITSRKFMDKVGLDPGCELIYLEDVKSRITIGDKLWALANGRLRSAESLHKYLGLANQRHDDPLTVIFTSGSTGEPKGVVLTGGNITSNVLGIDECIHLNANDVVLGILPFFHSFGYTVTLWAGLCLPCACVYHYSPLEARPIGNLAEKHGATVLLATPTFLRSYIRRIEPKQFSKMEIVVVGAEKMPLSMFDEFEDRFGVRPIEGYGTTELSPLVSVNIPPARDADGHGANLREGTVGKPVQRVEARVVNMDDDSIVLPCDEAGLLEIRGPNVMQGYLDRPDWTAAVMHDGWYRTGDVAKIHSEGFIEITGRLSRFSKIGGEMVPHIQIEEALAELLQEADDASTDSQEGQGAKAVEEDANALRVAVTSVPDPKRGERLIVLHTGMPIEPAEVQKRLTARGLPNLYLPGLDSFLQVEMIPVLGSGKLDLKALQTVAADHFAPASPQT